MPSWNDILNEYESLDDEERARRLVADQVSALSDISRLRDGRQVLFYASAFLQKSQAPAPTVQITHEDINGFMATVYGMDFERGLTLLMHTPGGVTNAAEAIVGYLRSKFDDLEVVVPTYAMSAGTMISLAADRVIMGRQSQLGPIDPQMPHVGRFVSARAIVEQFEVARTDILSNNSAAHVWAPILQAVGPALLQEAQNALDYAESMVADWLSRYMFEAQGGRVAELLGLDVARHFNDASAHKSHGRRIDRDEARQQGVKVLDLEDDQELQESVLTAYHLMTIAFEKGPASKVIAADTSRLWVKNIAQS